MASKSPSSAIMELSPLDQIMPRFYTRIILAIPLPSQCLEKVTDLLQEALKKTFQDIQFLGGSVINSKRGYGNLDVEIEDNIDWNILWSVKDLRATGESWSMSMEDLQNSSFPTSALKEAALAPISAVPDPTKPIKVMIARANLIKGGILLCAAFHHSVLDAVGFSVVFKRWASHCRGTPLEDPLDAKSLDRSVLIDKEVPSLPISEFKEYALWPAPQLTSDEATDATPAAAPNIPDMPISIFRFSSKSLRNLKDDIGAFNSSGSKLSTNDCLCALIWHAITLARYPPSISSENSAPEKTTLGFAINGRSRTSPSLPSTFLGTHILYGVATSEISTFQSMDSGALTKGSTASAGKQPEYLQPITAAIRTAITSVTASYTDRVIGLVKSLSEPILAKDESTKSTTASPHPSPAPLERLIPSFNRYLGPDIAISSWADIGLFNLRFFDPRILGLSSEAATEKSIGCVQAVRMPMMEAPAFDGLIIILPWVQDSDKKDRNADQDQQDEEQRSLEVMIGLEESAMKRLKEVAEKGEGLGRYGEWICE